MIKAIENEDVDEICKNMVNVLELVTAAKHPIIEEIKGIMIECGAKGAVMSGSGPTVFGIFDDKAKARQAMARIRELQIAKQVYIANVHNVRRI